ncbi:DUF1641 domain-containing protein [Neobacillus sp. SM06]|uniref:DUF1641 domain-containing protein n=1 Tax=Neobacillus sp. SM06 TaxID=3422492 RepID=UPI003D2A7089
MAKAVRKIQRIELSEEDKRRLDLQEVEDALVHNKEAILESLQVIQHMHDRGFLALLNGLFGQGDKVLKLLVTKADTPETANTLKNLLLMAGVLGTLDVKQLEPILIKVNAGIARVAEIKDHNREMSFFDIFRSLKDHEINRSITFMLEFLKGMGEDTRELERTTQKPEHQGKHTGGNETLKR